MSEIELQISAVGVGEYRVSVVASSAGDATGALTLDATALLDARERLETAVLASAVASRRMRPGEQPLRETGKALFDALFASASVASCYRSCLAVARDRGDRLRVVLRLDAPELAALPWEALFDPETGQYVCRQEPLVRRIPVAAPPVPLRVQPPLRILAVAASPRGLEPLDVERERDLLEAALAGPVQQGLVEIAWVESGRWADLHRSLLSGTWHVVHFIGHGDFDVERGEGLLALVRNDGRANLVAADTFLDLLREATPTPRLVVLNSCASATSAGGDLFSSTAATLVRGGVSAVTAMQFPVTDSAALAFCEGFYTAIAHGRGVDDAVRSGRVAILGLTHHTLEWVTPVLYLRGTETRLFELTGAPTAPPLVTAESPGGAPPAAVEDMYEAAMASYRRGDHGDALDLFGAVLVADQTFRDAKSRRDECARRQAEAHRAQAQMARQAPEEPAPRAAVEEPRQAAAQIMPEAIPMNGNSDQTWQGRAARQGWSAELVRKDDRSWTVAIALTFEDHTIEKTTTEPPFLVVNHLFVDHEKVCTNALPRNWGATVSLTDGPYSRTLKVLVYNWRGKVEIVVDDQQLLDFKWI